MVKKILLLVAMMVATTANAHEFRRAKTFEDAYLASCRVDVSNARGTGTFIGVDAENRRGVILTNYHVVTNNATATLNFWKNGEQKKISGKIFARFYDANLPADFALIAVDLDTLASIDPPYVALGGADAAPDVNSYILSSGAPKGRFVQAWRGRVLGYYRGATLLFQPGPVPGQSGSGVISEIGGELWLTAVLTWLIGTEGADDSHGGAIPVANLYKSLQGKRTGLTPTASPIPPGAVECAADATKVVEVTRDNCPACTVALADVNSLKMDGITVDVVNSSKEPDAANLYGVTAFPTFIVFDGTGKEVGRYVGAGHKKEIADKLATLKPAPKKVETKPIERVPSAFEENLEPSLSPDILSELTNSFANDTIPDEFADFRDRAAVYDLTNDVGFFEDSDTRWKRRGGTPEPSKPEPPKVEKVEPPQIDESRLGDRLSDRLGGKLSDALGDKLGGEMSKAIDTIGEEIERKLNARVDELRQDATSAVVRYAKRAAWLALGIAFVACLLAIFVVVALIALSARVYGVLFPMNQNVEKEDEKPTETKRNGAKNRSKS